MARRSIRTAGRTRRGTLLLATVLGLRAATALAGERVDLELLLAVDVSSSVDDGEFALQTNGFAAAFRDPNVLAAIEAAGERGIAVGLMQWSDYALQTMAVDWRLVRDAVGAAALADAISRAGRVIPGGGTAIYAAINAGLPEFDRNGFDGRRRIIDISGDGRSDISGLNELARDRATAKGVIINGLAILNDVPTLDRYYRESVIGGPGAFVLTAPDFEAFAAAITAKLIREISETPVAGLHSRIRPAALPHRFISSRHLRRAGQAAPRSLAHGAAGVKRDR